MQNSDVVSLFLDLVKIDSPSGEESAVADFIRQKLSDLGITSTLDKSGNLFARIPGRDEPVLLSSHMDTVEPGRGIKPVITDGIITSDGTTILGSDNKSAIAAILSALQSVDKSSLRSLELVFSVREETSSGISEFDFSKVQSKTGVVPDHHSDIGSVILSAPWLSDLHIKITGVPAHASLPEQGVNALSVAAAAISQTTWGRIDTDTTSNIGLIQGGSAMNTIPGEVILTGEVRSFSPETMKSYCQTTQAKFTDICQKFGAGCEFVIDPYGSGYAYTQSDPAVTDIVSAMEKSGIKPFYEKVFGASDANAFAAHGISVVAIGDGGKNLHTTKEQNTVTNLELLKKLLVAYIIKSNE